MLLFRIICGYLTICVSVAGVSIITTLFRNITISWSSCGIYITVIQNTCFSRCFALSNFHCRGISCCNDYRCRRTNVIITAIIQFIGKRGWRRAVIGAVVILNRAARMILWSRCFVLVVWLKLCNKKCLFVYRECVLLCQYMKTNDIYWLSGKYHISQCTNYMISSKPQ